MRQWLSTRVRSSVLPLPFAAGRGQHEDEAADSIERSARVATKSVDVTERAVGEESAGSGGTATLTKTKDDRDRTAPTRTPRRQHRDVPSCGWQRRFSSWARSPVDCRRAASRGGKHVRVLAVAAPATAIVFLALSLRRDLRWLGMFVVGAILLTLGAAVTILYTESAQLVPALKSVWLVIHVLAAIISGGAFTIGAAVTALYLSPRSCGEQGRWRSGDRLVCLPRAVRQAPRHRWRTASTFVFPSGRSPSSPVRSGRRTPGVATGAGIRRRRGHSSRG